MKAKSVKFRFKVLMTSLAIVGLSACSNSNYEEKVSVAETDITEDYEAITIDDPNLAPPTGITTPIPQDLKIIKSSNVKYKVKNVKKATNAIKRMAMDYDAYISDLRFENNQYRKEIRFTIKVPAHHFDAIMDSIDSVSEFTDYENITTKDVTEEYIDIQTRLQTKLEVKARYEEVLRKKATTVEDILATEDKLRVIQEEIESAQGRLKYLTNKVSYSTIQIDLYETVNFKDEPVVYNKTFWSKTKEGLKFGWNMIESLILGVIYIWPLLLLGTITIILFRYYMKKGKKA